MIRYPKPREQHVMQKSKNKIVDWVNFGKSIFRYGESFRVSEEVLDPNFTLPIGKAKVCSQTSFTFSGLFASVLTVCDAFFYVQQIEKEGTDVTITAFSRMVGYALKVNMCIFPYIQIVMSIHAMKSLVNHIAISFSLIFQHLLLRLQRRLRRRI